MKTSNYNPKAKLAATSLVLVLVVSATGILLVSGVMSWISTNSDLTLRVNRLRATTAAGGAATEKAIGQILSDFQVGGILNVTNKLDSYTTLVPSDQDLLGTVENILDPVLDPILGPILGPPPPEPESETTREWADYEFSDGNGNTRKSQVAAVSPWTYGQLSSGFEGIGAYSATYRLLSNVRDAAHKHQTLAGVQQDVVLASIPVFGFHVFYAPELEISPSTTLTLGRVHANKTIYCDPAGTLTFAGPVTTAQRIIHDKHPADPVSRPNGQIISQSDREGGVNTLMPAIGTNRSLADLRKIIEIPPLSESQTSALGKQRLYNKADLIIRITPTGNFAHSGAYNSFGTTIPWSALGEKNNGKGYGPKKKSIDSVVETDVIFDNLREGKTVRCTEIDVSLLMAKSNYFMLVLGRPVKTLYVADTRADMTSVQGGVRIVLGQTLPASGLTIVTPNPLYVVGDYNVPTTLLGTTNTSKSAPAALIADAITILSDQFTDKNSGLGLSQRPATNTMINAALLGGIVPTRNGYYSGGLENFPRLLEDWTGDTLTINGSFVALFESKQATGPWGYPDDVYRPPQQRKWSFDPRLNTLAGLPPSTPELQTAFRRSWQNVLASR